jgi:hypothetical protein
MEKLRATIERLSSCSGSFCAVSPSRRIPGTVNAWESYSPMEESFLSFSDLEPTGGPHLAWSNLSPEELLEAFHQKKLWKLASIVWAPSYFQGSDYGGSLVELSNLQSFLEDHREKPGVWELSGGWGSFGLALDVRFLTEELLEELEALESYPLRCEDHLSSLELEEEGKAWESWAASDFREELEKLLEEKLEASEEELEALEEKLEALPEEKLFQLFQEATEDASLYWETEVISRWIDCRKVAEAVSQEALLEALELAA